jgi:hypothetical protein
VRLEELLKETKVREADERKAREKDALVKQPKELVTGGG